MCEHGIESCAMFFTRQNNDWNIWKPLVLDSCLVKVVTKLNSDGIRTLGSCCGHFRSCGGIPIDPDHAKRAKKLGYMVSKRKRRTITKNEDYNWTSVQIQLLNNCDICLFDKEFCECVCHE